MNDIYKCEFCNEPMTEDEYYFCDICPECRDDPNRSESYEQISMAIVQRQYDQHGSCQHAT